MGPSSADLGIRLREWALRRPDAPAVVFRGARLSYGELEARVRRVEGALTAQGLGRGDRVGLVLERGPDLLTAMLAALRLGIAYVPVDPHHPRDRSRAALAAARPALVVADGAGRALDLDRHRVLGPSQLRSASRSTNAIGEPAAEGFAAPEGWPSATDEHIAYVMFTSGSTGRPKGCVIRHGGLRALFPAVERRFEFRSDDVFLAAGSVAFDLSVLELLLPIWLGATVHLIDEATRAHPAALAEAIEASEVTVINTTPTVYRLLLAAGWRGKPQAKLLSGGEAMTPELAAALLERGGELWNKYGPTECTVIVAGHRVERPDDADRVGAPLGATRFSVRDQEGQPADAGELEIEGPQVGAGYLDDAEATAAAFARSPGRPPSFRTGDLVVVQGGTLRIRGRKDHQAKIDGVRVDLGDLESALLGHPGVAHCAVVRPDGGSPVAVYVPVAEGEAVDCAALRANLAGRFLPAVWPREFLAVERLPLTPTGKIDRSAILDALPRLRPEAVPPVEPRVEDELERLLERTWRDALASDRPLDRAESLHDRGARSAAALEVLVRMERAVGLRIPAAAFVAAGTIAAQADLLRRVSFSQHDADETGVVQLTDGEGAPLFCLCGIHLYADLARELRGPVFGVSVELEREVRRARLRPPTVEELAERSVEAILSAHPGGPLRLAGASFGGLVAFEAARRLVGRGYVVEGLVALDTSLPWALQGRRARAREALGWLRWGTRWPLDIWDANARWAKSTYLARSPGPYDLPVLLVRARQRYERGAVSYDLGWSRLLSLGPSVVEVASDHLGVVNGDGVPVTARAISAFFVDDAGGAPVSRRSSGPTTAPSSARLRPPSAPRASEPSTGRRDCA